MIFKVQGVYQNGAVPASTAAPLVPVEVPLSVPAGADFEIDMTVVGQDGAVVDLTSATLEMAVRAFDFDVAPVFSIAGSSLTSGGAAKFVGPSALTAALPVDRYRWAAWLKIGGLRAPLVLTSAFQITAPGVAESEGP